MLHETSFLASHICLQLLICLCALAYKSVSPGLGVTCHKQLSGHLPGH